MRELILALTLLFSVNALASPCRDTAQSEQWVIALEGVEGHAAWKVEPGEIHPLTAANGLPFGVKITPVPADFYRERMGGRSAMPEMVEIGIYDLREDPPRRLAHNYAGSNSIQAYAQQELGPGGVDFFLHKAVCATLEALAGG